MGFVRDGRGVEDEGDMVVVVTMGLRDLKMRWDFVGFCVLMRLRLKLAGAG